METLKLWADFHVGQQMYAYDHFDVVERKRYWRPVSKTYLVHAWLRDLIRGMRDARLGGFQGWLYCVVKDGGFTTQEFMGFNDEIEVL
ncbi:hypothetical protein B0703_05895 [Bifidobacterium adolescentis]|uniref:Uncharacterized protein n=2 Tax=Bifidobacterium adolescentis TaxID=1680 RepID=A0AAF0VE96_BIFAD|nr:hypothetical protein [Bifidobacterium adolescentis]WNE86413.1 hypothetical protein B0703_05895 [Bifidobacterium adolescentis]